MKCLPKVFHNIIMWSRKHSHWKFLSLPLPSSECMCTCYIYLPLYRIDYSYSFSIMLLSWYILLNWQLVVRACCFQNCDKLMATGDDSSKQAGNNYWWKLVTSKQHYQNIAHKILLSPNGNHFLIKDHENTKPYTFLFISQYNYVFLQLHAS